MPSRQKNLSGDLPASQVSGTLNPNQLPPEVPLVNGDPNFTGSVSFNKPNSPPFAVSSSEKVANLNSELLDGFDSASFWKLLGNAGTDPNANFLGTTDNQALTIRVNNFPGFRVIPADPVRTDPGSAPLDDFPSTPNIVGGYGGNTISIDARGATIAGGGSQYDHAFHGGPGKNEIDQAGDFSFIGSGSANYLKGPHNSIVGGHYNRIVDANYSVISGGGENLIVAPVDAGAIVAGVGNTLSNLADTAFIGAGHNNTATNTAAFIGAGGFNLAGGAYSVAAGGSNNLATGFASSVPGGTDNRALGDYSFAAGSSAQAGHDRTFVWNSLQNSQFASTTPNQFLIQASGGVGINLNNPSEALEVAGNVKAVKFIGDGSMLTGVTGTPGPAGPAGAPGMNGADGTVWRSGVGVPDANLGTEGDYYLNLSNGDVFKRVSNVYSVQGNISGPTGPAGAPGANGADGVAGTVWRSGAGVPDSNLGTEGDYYLNLSNGDVFRKGNNSYGFEGNIAGPVGPQGLTGLAGPTGPAGPQGPIGSTGPTGPQGEMGFTGPAGPQGATGPAGPQGPTGATGPAGPAGPEGPMGSQGAQGLPGPVGPAGSQGVQGITGPAGPEGSQGVMGATGPAGPQGPPGSADAWSRTGNPGTTSANFLGTTDPQPLELRVNNFTALRLVHSTGAQPVPNLIGGAAINSIDPSVYGSVIAGGGINGVAFNSIFANNGFIGSGEQNSIMSGANSSGIMGGHNNSIGGNSGYSTISGGNDNAIGANAGDSFIGGGGNNIANGGSAVIGGGQQNRLQGSVGTIGGGQQNFGFGNNTTIAGGSFNTNAAQSGAIGGGERNLVTALHGTIPGGTDAMVRSEGQMAYASGAFAVNGDAQASLYVLRTTTISANPTDLTANGTIDGNPLMTMPLNSVWAFDILVVASSSGSGPSAGFQITGVARRAANGIVSVLSSIPPNVLYRDSGAISWTINVGGDGSGGGHLHVVALSGTGVNWVANVRTVEVIK
jgi:hypothetical protein